MALTSTSIIALARHNYPEGLEHDDENPAAGAVFQLLVDVARVYEGLTEYEPGESLEAVRENLVAE